MPDDTVMERHGFQAEVARLLDIVAHSLYSDKAVFLRELVSNASDACDKLRYLSLTQPGLAADDPAFRVTLAVDAKARTLTVADNGIGMNRDDLVENLGTIARSGTAAFLSQACAAAQKDDAKDLGLIGQFGVGFYSAFMVADEVEVLTRRAGESAGWRWVSDGKGEFTVSAADVASRGTRIVLHLKKGEDEFLEPARLKQIVAKYSDHIAIPIRLVGGDKDGGDRTQTLNSASALWMRPKAQVTAEQYKEFYHHVAHAFDEPWGTVHFRAEGKIEYAALLFVPTARPFDLFNPERKNCLKLYVKRVFIAEACEELLPGYLRFLKGVVDSEDLPLNISREMLQHNPVLAKIRAGVTKRVLAELKKKADGDAEAYATFWDVFGAVLKEGLYEAGDQREAILGLARFRSTRDDGLTSLADHAGRMKQGQEAIYYIAADDLATAKRSPQLEGFAARGIEVLLLTDPVDEFWIPSVGTFQDKPFRSVTRGGADLDKIAAQDGEKQAAAPQPAGTDALVALLRLTLEDAVKDVRASQRLTDSAVCLVAADGDLDMHLERLLKLHKQIDAGAKRVLEINPGHELIAGLAAALSAGGNSDAVADAAWLLLDQALILQGEPVADPAAFARRLAGVMQRSLATR